MIDLEEVDFLRDEDKHAAIARINAALPDSDPRKITRDETTRLRELVAWAAGSADSPSIQQHTKAKAAKAVAFLDALESYLPPPMLYHGGPHDGLPVLGPATKVGGVGDPPLPPDANGYYQWSEERGRYEWIEGPPPPLNYLPPVDG